MISVIKNGIFIRRSIFLKSDFLRGNLDNLKNDYIKMLIASSGLYASWNSDDTINVLEHKKKRKCRGRMLDSLLNPTLG